MVGHDMAEESGGGARQRVGGHLPIVAGCRPRPNSALAI
jgi:hypothetical protein